MSFNPRAFICALSLIPIAAFAAAGTTSVAGLSFEELTDRSQVIVAGQVTRSWSAWDSEHKVIWTHHELTVSSLQKGSPGSTVMLSEPGGVVGERGMTVAGSVAYRPGDRVLVFLERMPNGYLRTTGWGQGKYTIDKGDHLHAEIASHDVEFVNTQNPGVRRTTLSSLEGMSVANLRARVAARIAVQAKGSTK